MDEDEEEGGGRRIRSRRDGTRKEWRKRVMVSRPELQHRQQDRARRSGLGRGKREKASGKKEEGKDSRKREEGGGK